jgi:anti-sigma factor RsiW
VTGVGCDAFGRDLGPFIDGELDGTRMLRVSRHLETCDECAAALEDLEQIGRSLRRVTPTDVPLAALDGLAADVLSRVNAESAVSWRATLRRGVDDWHWAIVGGGALVATFVSTSLLSVMLAFGPAPQREDSLSALTTDLSSPAGFLFVFASPTGDAGQDVEMLQVANGRPAAPRLVSDLVVSREHGSVTEAELVERFQQVVTRNGRVVSLESLEGERRMVAEALLDELTRLRSRQPGSRVRSFQVHEMRLVTSTVVTAGRS